MPISEDNTRTLITLPKQLKKDLEKEAQKEKRSFNNYVLTILENRPKK